MKLNKQEIHVFFVNKEVIVYNIPIQELHKNIENKLKLNPKDIISKQILVQILYKYYNDYKQALKLIKDVLIQDYSAMDSILDLVEIFIDYEIGTKDQCRNLLDLCLRDDDKYWRISFVEIRLFDSLDIKDSKIIIYMQQVLKKFPNNIWLTAYYYQIKTEDDSLKLSDIPIDFLFNSKYQDFDMLRRIAYILNNLHQIDLILEILSYSLQLNPKSYNCLNNYGYFQRIHKQDNDKCIEYCLKSLNENPRQVTGLQNVGITYQSMAKYKESTEYYLKCIALCNFRPNQYKNIIINYIELNDYENAKYYSIKGLKKFPNSLLLNLFYQDSLRMLADLNENASDQESIEIYSIKSINFPKYDLPEEDYQIANSILNEVYDTD